jgi:hypothetical protein
VPGTRPPRGRRERPREQGGPPAAEVPAEYQPTGKPDSYPWGAPRSCFYNAFILSACSPGLRYGEGYALAFLGTGGTEVWSHHAWVITPDGNAIDNTWRKPGLRYVGIAINPRDLTRRQAAKARPDRLEPVLATWLPLIGDISEATWGLADWYTGKDQRLGPPAAGGGL